MDCRYRTPPPSQVLIAWDSTKRCLHNVRFPDIPNPVIVNLAEEGQDLGSKRAEIMQTFPLGQGTPLRNAYWSFMTKSTPATAARAGRGGAMQQPWACWSTLWLIFIPNGLSEVWRKFLLWQQQQVLFWRSFTTPPTLAFVSFSVWSIKDWSEADAGSVSIILIQASLIIEGDAATFVKV